MTPDEPLVLVLGVITATLAVTRAVRLIVDDRYPPTEWLKLMLVKRLPEKWHEVLQCPWCVAPYFSLPAALWFSTLVVWPGSTWNLYLWWIVNATAAVSWVAAFATLRDQPPDSR